MKKYIPFLFFFLFTSKAQEISLDKWHYGEIDLNSGKTVKGMIKYNFKNNMIDYHRGQVHRKYNARNVIAFQIRDTLSGYIRTFYSFKLLINEDFIPSFFELLVDGHLSLLCRSLIQNRTTNFPYDGFSTTRVTNRVLVNKFFLIKNYGKLVELPKSPQDILEVLKDEDKKLKEYIKKNRLDLFEKEDFATLIRYYNKLNNVK